MPIVSWKGGEVDVAVIGAGAAGVGAARRLQALRPDLSIVLLEASDRVGGRARTIHPFGAEGPRARPRLRLAARRTHQSLDEDHRRDRPDGRSHAGALERRQPAAGRERPRSEGGGRGRRRILRAGRRL
ncbi:FAD-dependent oxidoreductase [Rhizobium sp. P44RR-XXIV]|nr:FAD-dependent oxidoreductase [Rhizobium sp. P44RR-XXIV]